MSFENQSQAYQLKSIIYKGNKRRILMQNLNGPCPLIAAANALLLSFPSLNLPAECIRNSVASTEEIVNLLANHALQNGSVQKNNSNNSQEYHLNEVLSMLPNLQHGMDLNPKFTAGPTGVELTSNVAAFDLLGIKLVHGWLVDPQDVEALSVIGEKTYNELIETVVNGNEAKDAVEKIQIQISEKRDAYNQCGFSFKKIEDGNEPVEVAKEFQVVATNETDQETKPSMSEDVKNEVDKEIIELRDKMNELSLQICISEAINTFFTSTGHQLTYHGLEQLHSHLAEDALCVFFRNNHYATITKHDGILYLLVTDLGYYNVPEIVWEKLDEVNGDTEYFNEKWRKPPPREELKPADGPTIDPQLLLAQRSQAESDYQLALALSKGTSNQQADNDEGKLIEAAKALSLQTHNGETEATVSVDAGSATGNTSQLDSDLEVAMAYQRAQKQSEHESEQLARQLQELEYARQTPSSNSPRTRPDARPTSSKQQSGCTVS